MRKQGVSCRSVDFGSCFNLGFFPALIRALIHWRERNQSYHLKCKLKTSLFLIVSFISGETALTVCKSYWQTFLHCVPRASELSTAGSQRSSILLTFTRGFTSWILYLHLCMQKHTRTNWFSRRSTPSAESDLSGRVIKGQEHPALVSFISRDLITVPISPHSC